MYRRILLVALLLCILLHSPTVGYRFRCLEYSGGSCECDTDDELIDCNGRGWTKFPELRKRLRGYSVLTLAFNRIEGPLPTEAEVLKQLPDLELLDLRGNDKLDCDEILSKFDKINVNSHCIEKELAKELAKSTVSMTTTTTVLTTMKTIRPKPPPKPTEGARPPWVRPPTVAPPPPPVKPLWPDRREPQPQPPPAPRPYPPEFVPPLTSVPCRSVWCRLGSGMATATRGTYEQVHRVWTRMKDRIRQPARSLKKSLFSIFD